VLSAPPPARARIRVQLREPLRPVSAWLDALERDLPAGGRLELVDGPRPLVTMEGEHAAFVVARARVGRSELLQALGLIVAEHTSVVDARADAPGEFDAVRALAERLTVEHCLGLGHARWRPFFYRPPVGWHGSARVRADRWFAPEHPRQPGIVTVF